MIKSLSLRNFTNFEGIDIDFSPKVNVFVGKGDMAEDIEKELLQVFMPLDDHLGNMYRQGSNPWGALSAKLGKEGSIDCSFSEVSRYLEIEQDRYLGSTGEPAFIPTP
ncbi:hypothetical protein [Dethiosulfovibrio salsuginis]|uniref:Uncharacterized protein n=1 Tax=Dethiosulfovibrio salsuginis TaxID=561720 RepID=A0A1X7LFM1_9BACT|nr:hypothetical protein [Dethiosulfovibrio salsuginis]SMG52480.1 hypothetical protein SAMN06275492_1631 [Dethiosulfovibrio salsuginis]